MRRCTPDFGIRNSFYYNIFVSRTGKCAPSCREISALSGVRPQRTAFELPCCALLTHRREPAVRFITAIIEGFSHSFGATKE